MAEVNIGNCKTETEFYIVADAEGQYEPLLCNKTAKQLGVLKIGEHLAEEHGTEKVRRVEQFSKLRNFQLKILIDETVQPVIQPCRQLPFQLRAPMKKRIEELLEADVIEQVDGPTPWVSPIVVDLRKNGDICVCVDTVSYTHLTLPTIYSV